MGNAYWMDGVIATTAVVAMAVMAQVALRSASALLRHSVWRISLVAFWAVPAAILAVGSLHLQPRVVEIPMPRISHAATESPAAEPADQDPATAVSDAPTQGTMPAPEAHRHLTVASLRPLAVPALLLLWALGAAVGIGRTVRHLMLLRKLARDSEPIGDSTVTARLAHWAGRMGLAKPPAAACCPQTAIPFVVGWRAPMLLLPPEGDGPDAAHDAVLVHELAHIRRGDMFVQTVAQFTKALWWWHPLAWIMAAELRASAEEACDDWVVSLSEERQRYAELLVSWAQAAPSVGVLSYVRPGRSLVQRVKRILADHAPLLRLPRRTRAGLAVFAVVVVAGAGIGRVRVAGAASGTPRRVYNGPVLDERLKEAVVAGNLERVENLLASGVSPRGGTKDGRTALHWVADGPVHNSAEIAKRLLDKGLQARAADVDDVTPLHLAAGGNSAELVKLLLDRGADVNAMDLPTGPKPAGCWGTPLHWGATGGRPDTMLLLLQHGAQVNCRNAAGQTPLHAAAQSAWGQQPWDRHREAAQLLIDHGADINAVDKSGRTPLTYAAMKCATPMVAWLLDHGADANAAGRRGLTPLDGVALMATRRAQPDPELVRLLAAKGATWTIQSATALGNLQKLTEFLDQGADANGSYPGDKGPTLLWWAAAAGQADVIEALLARGADVNRPMPFGIGCGVPRQLRGRTRMNAASEIAGRGSTPLHRAAWCGRLEATRALLHHGARTDVVDELGLTPLDEAVAVGNTDVTRLLLANGAQWTVEAAAFLGDTWKMEELLAHGADPNVEGMYGEAALHWAAARGDVDMVKLLLAHHADPDIGENGDTPLYWATGRRRSEWPNATDAIRADVARALLGYGAHVNVHGPPGGWTPLHAVRRDQPLLAEVLIEHGADRNAEDDQGERPRIVRDSGTPSQAPRSTVVR